MAIVVDKVTLVSGREDMATANVTNDLEHFLNCGVCFCEFDDDTRKPKFLQCAHTVCLKCLQEICQLGSITCPFCRQSFLISNTASLPNNSYALRMITLREELREKPNVQGPTSLLKSIGNQEFEKLFAVLQKRKKVEAQLELIMKSITAVGDEVKKLQEENNLEMAQLISVIEISPEKAEKATNFPLASVSSIPNTFLINNVVQPRPKYVFILKVSNQNGPVGQIRIRPAPKFHPEFVQKLGEFCYKSPNKFSSTIDMAQPGALVSVLMYHGLFRPTLGLVKKADLITALMFGEVGLIGKKRIVMDWVIGYPSFTEWNFFFPLYPVNYQQKLFISSTAAELFGHIINTSIGSPAIETLLTELSKSKKDGREHFVITIESEYDS